MTTDIHTERVLEPFDYRKRVQKATGVEREKATAERLEFWVDTCRDATHFRVGSKAVQELYREHGCLFHEPAHVHVQEILDALDVAMPTWDRDYPHLFYETLKVNFPELIRAH